MIKVLIIDKTAEHREVLAQAFVEMYCETYCFDDGKVGLDKAKEIRPNLIVYDGTLEYAAPDFANDAVREFDPDGDAKDRPYMVLLTASPNRKQRVLCEEMGFNEYAAKPTTIETLKSWVSKSVNSKKTS
jgi:CheY-like chemotaxis protein